MNRLFYALALALPFIGVSASQPSVLLIGEAQRPDSGRTLVSGPGRAFVKAGSQQMRIDAREIVYDARKNSLECTGDVEIKSDVHVIKAQKLEIELGDVAALFATARVLPALPSRPIPQDPIRFDARAEYPK